MRVKRIVAVSLFAASLVFASEVAWTAGQYGPGAGDTEIKIGNTMPYSGPASSYGVIGKSEAAYFVVAADEVAPLLPSHGFRERLDSIGIFRLLSTKNSGRCALTCTDKLGGAIEP